MTKERKKRAVYSVDTAIIEEKANNSNYDDKDIEILKVFAKRLNNELEIQNITQEDFCSKIDVKSGALSNYRNGVRFPQANTLLKMADALGVSIDYLMGKTKVKTYSNEELHKMFGLTDNSIDILKAVYPKESLNVLFDCEDGDMINYLLEEIQNYKSVLLSLNKYNKGDKFYKQSIIFEKIVNDVNFAKFRIQTALQSIIDEYFKKEIDEYNKK